jgi:hypothetical protein
MWLLQGYNAFNAFKRFASNKGCKEWLVSVMFSHCTLCAHALPRDGRRWGMHLVVIALWFLASVWLSSWPWIQDLAVYMVHAGVDRKAIALLCLKCSSDGSPKQSQSRGEGWDFEGALLLSRFSRAHRSCALEHFGAVRGSKRTFAWVVPSSRPDNVHKIAVFKLCSNILLLFILGGWVLGPPLLISYDDVPLGMAWRQGEWLLLVRYWARASTDNIQIMYIDRYA